MNTSLQVELGMTVEFGAWENCAWSYDRLKQVTGALEDAQIGSAE